MIWLAELRKNLMAQASIAFLLVMVTLALLAPVLGFTARADEPDLARRNTAPGWVDAEGRAHWLGCDQQGRDVLARVVAGAGTSLLIAAVAVTLSTGTGLLLGLLAGYSGGRVDHVVMRGVDVAISIPSILMTLTIITLLGPGVLKVAVVIGLTNWVWQARTARAKVLVLRQEPFILAAKISGAGHWWIIRKHVLPNIRGTVLVVATTQLGYMIIIESSLSFFGMSGTTLSWGWDIARGRDYLSTAWWITSMPGLAILLTAVSFNVVGDWLRDVLDPYLRT